MQIGCVIIDSNIVPVFCKYKALTEHTVNMVTKLQILMSVPREQITVYSVVVTLLVLTHVTATLVTDLLQMVEAVMVNS